MSLAHEDNTVKETCWRKFVNWFQDKDDNRRKDKEKWLENMRGMLSVVSTMISSITFQASINPVGGVFQAGDGIKVEDLRKCLSDKSMTCAGAAILPLIYPGEYHNFQVCNTFCFVASLCVTLLLVSGIPLNHRLPTWILSIGMIFTLTSLTLTYLYGLRLICPEDQESWNDTLKIVRNSINAWLAIVGIVTVILTIRLLLWLVKKCIKGFVKVFKCTSQ